MRAIVVIIVTFVAATTAHPQDKTLIDALQKLDARVFTPDSADAKLRTDTLKKMREDVNKKDVEAWRAIKTKADWEKFRDDRLAKLRDSLGKFPPAPKEVKVVVTGRLQGDGFTIENLIYESRPGLFVTANLYVPAKTDQPMPGLIVIHSHHNPKTQGELQDMGMNWARQGCLVLIPDMLGHGERRQHPFIDKTSYSEAYKIDRQDYYFRYNTALQLHLVGESLIGWMVWDLMRGLDVLYQRPNLDKSKIVVCGSVAGGGDPCAVFAALDQRVTAAAPFNFGGPQPETPKLGEDAEFAFNYMGGGSWESTRNLRLSARDGFLPWLIVGSMAPRGLIYGHEFAWDAERDPVWARFQKIWGFYEAADKLASVKGRGSVKGQPPEATHCNNIGPVHRQQMYPMLKQWFGLPIPEKEYQNRFKASELQCWTDEARMTLKPKMLHEILGETAAKMPPNGDPRYARLFDLETRILGITTGVSAKIKIPWSPTGMPKLNGTTCRVEQVVIRHSGDASIAVPALILRAEGMGKIKHVVIGLAQDGKAGFLKHRAETIAELLKHNVAVCLPDLRGTGEVSAEGRGRSTGSTSYSASLSMHGQTVAGVQLRELLLLMAGLKSAGYDSVSLWGDSFVEPNDPKTNFAIPYEAGKLPRQSEPMGATLAMLGGIVSRGQVKAIYVRGGMADFRVMLDSPFCYYPHDAVIPGIVPFGGIERLAAAECPLRTQAMVDGLNRRVDQKALSSPAEVAAFLTK
jgi:dienelactone hydrolase